MAQRSFFCGGCHINSRNVLVCFDVECRMCHAILASGCECVCVCVNASLFLQQNQKGKKLNFIHAGMVERKLNYGYF